MAEQCSCAQRESHSSWPSTAGRTVEQETFSDDCSKNDDDDDDGDDDDDDDDDDGPATAPKSMKI